MTVTADPLLTVKLDDGRTVSLDTRLYDHVQLGYSFTTHKAQGMTAEHSFILAGGPMTSRELTYVQASRARGDSRWYLDDELSSVVARMKQSRAKEAALTIANELDLELTLGR